MIRMSIAVSVMLIAGCDSSSTPPPKPPPTVTNTAPAAPSAPASTVTPPAPVNSAAPATTAAPATPPAAKSGITYSGGDGSSFDKAVIILGADDTDVGIAAERTWITQNHPGFQKIGQSLQGDKGRKFDVIEIGNGTSTKYVYFDISDFFGKFNIQPDK